MKFGTLVLSESKSLYLDSSMGSMSYSTVIKIRPGKFIFRRPDNGDIILEIDDNVFQCSPKDVYLLNPANAEYFKSLIHEYFQRSRDKHCAEIEAAAAREAPFWEKIGKLQADIRKMEERNEVEYSENRARHIKEVRKAIHRSFHKLDVLRANGHYNREQLAPLDDAEAYSVDYFDKVISSVFSQSN